MNTLNPDDDVMVIEDADDNALADPSNASSATWTMLIVDDDEDMHHVTRLVLSNFQFQGCPLELISAFSGAEGFEVLKKKNNIAVILLDVVMETDDAGLVLTRRIREELNNHLVRIILRTGQSGQAPESEVIEAYDINDYKDKSELTVLKLRTAVISALRTYIKMFSMEATQQALEERDAKKSAAISALHEEMQNQLNAAKNNLDKLSNAAHNPADVTTAQQDQVRMQALVERLAEL